MNFFIHICVKFIYVKSSGLIFIAKCMLFQFITFMQDITRCENILLTVCVIDCGCRTRIGCPVNERCFH